MDRIADILKECGELRMEIAGHTDSQGREVMNQQLSLDRARAVLEELRLRRVLTSQDRRQGLRRKHTDRRQRHRRGARTTGGSNSG